MSDRDELERYLGRTEGIGDEVIFDPADEFKELGLDVP